MGELLGECDEETETVLTCDVDLAAANHYRIYWNLFRDRRPDIYGAILTLDGIGFGNSIA